MKSSVLICILLWFFTKVIAVEQRMLIGKVIDENHNSIPYCVVKVLTTDRATYCNELGVFAISANNN